MHAVAWHGGWLMGGMWLVWIALFIVFGLAMRDVLAPARRRDSPDLDPEESLKQRYARGELGPYEYQARLADLRK